LSKYYLEQIRKLKERIAQLQKEGDYFRSKTTQDEKDKLIPSKDTWMKMKQENDSLTNEIQTLKDDTNVAKLNNTGKARTEELGKLQFESAKANSELNRILTENERLTIEINHYRALLQQANKETTGDDLIGQHRKLEGGATFTPPVKRVKLFISPTKPVQIKFQESMSGAIRIKEIHQMEKHIELENMTDSNIDLKEWCLKLCTSKSDSYSEIFPDGAVLEENSTVIAEIKDENSAWWFEQVEVDYFVLLLNQLGEVVARVDVVLDNN